MRKLFETSKANVDNSPKSFSLKFLFDGAASRHQHSWRKRSLVCFGPRREETRRTSLRRAAGGVVETSPEGFSCYVSLISVLNR